jgi:hypothetical protein
MPAIQAKGAISQPRRRCRDKGDSVYRRQQAKHLIRQADHRHQDNQHGGDVDQQGGAFAGSTGNGLHGAVIGRWQLQVLPGRLTFGGDQNDGKYDRRGRADERGCEDVTQRIGHHRAENAGVQSHHRACDASHATAEDDEHLATTDARQVGTDQQGRFHHADEHIGRG